MYIVGLPNAVVNESRDRVRNALRNSGPHLSPQAHHRQLRPSRPLRGRPAYDLSIAVCLLAASEQLFGDVSKAMFVGELSLDGAARHTDLPCLRKVVYWHTPTSRRFG